jgi:hypothetical protein
MKEFFRRKLGLQLAALGLVASITGTVLAGICPRTIIIVGGGSVTICDLYLEIAVGGDSDCYYECTTF